MTAVSTPIGKVMITPKGAWSSSTTYSRLDLVTNDGSSFLALKSVPAGTSLTSTDYWQPVALKGEAGASITQDMAQVQGVLSIANGGTGATTAAAARTNLGAAAASHTHSYAGSSSAGGAATSATKLSTARTIQTNLGSTTAESFDGSANVTPGVTGTLPIANGGTGATTAAAALTNLGAMQAEPASIELRPASGTTYGGYIDFHYGGSSNDYTSRIIEESSGRISIKAKLQTTGEINMKSANMNSAAASIDAPVYLPIGVVDTNGRYVGYVQFVQLATGEDQIQVAARRYNSGNVNNQITLGVKPDGTKTVSVTDPALWRNALGLGNTSGALPIANGGTGATTAAAARTNLGVTAMAVRPNYTVSTTDLTAGSSSLTTGQMYLVYE